MYHDNIVAHMQESIVGAEPSILAWKTMNPQHTLMDLRPRERKREKLMSMKDAGCTKEFYCHQSAILK